MSAVFTGGDTFFLLEHLAEIMRGGEAALSGDLGNGILLLPQHIACRLYSDNVKIGYKGYANVLWEHVTKVIPSYSEFIGNILNAHGRVVIFVNILNY